MLNRIYILLPIMLLSACANTQDTTFRYDLPPELSDCKSYLVAPKEKSSMVPELYVIRCPNSSTATTYSSGKSRFNITVTENK